MVDCLVSLAINYPVHLYSTLWTRQPYSLSDGSLLILFLLVVVFVFAFFAFFFFRHRLLPCLQTRRERKIEIRKEREIKMRSLSIISCLAFFLPVEGGGEGLPRIIGASALPSLGNYHTIPSIILDQDKKRRSEQAGMGGGGRGVVYELSFFHFLVIMSVARDNVM